MTARVGRVNASSGQNVGRWPQDQKGASTMRGRKSLPTNYRVLAQSRREIERLHDTEEERANLMRMSSLKRKFQNKQTL